MNRGGITRLEVCNRHTNAFELTEPKQYTDWLIERNGYSGSNSFRKVTRLVKYLRDIKGRFTCSSVLLTTLLGYRIGSSDKGSSAFADTPTALKTIFGRLDDWLQGYPFKPTVTNPFLWSENFADAWTDEQYTNLRDKIHTYREWIDEAYDEPERNESIAKWRRVFDEDFAKGVVVEEGRLAGQSVLANLRRTLMETASFTGDLVDAVKQFGGRILPASFNKKSYMEVPKEKRAAQMMPVAVRAELHRSKHGTQPVGTVSSLQPLPPGHWLRFKAVSKMNFPFDSRLYRVKWRVTNTDEVAARANCLRGRFEDPENDNSRWEQLTYRGVHLVEAFVISKRDNRIVAQSEPFRVMIE